MTNEEKNIIKNIILSEIEDIKDDIIYLEEATKPVAPDCSIGRVSRMEALGSKGVNEALLENSKNKLSLLEKNLNKIGTDSFGRCVKCSNPIEIKRFIAIPEAQVCMKCSK
jgi:DnaK suppressor protein